ncbi:MAG: 4-hydroxy-3-methylbut-2-enyl diphosphate reductase [candidate division Zixibacteria bacterium]|nr:4-hydroxy-3-methylbut-2-enyl diphosphate reductase [candidate division Zixibacteria bacterium]
MIEKITLARHYGFCMGVKRAITIAEDTSRDSAGDVNILNEIVHNEAVVERFRRQGVGQVFSHSDASAGTLIISAHGVAPNVITEAKDRGLNVVDATCPLVTRIYDIVQKVVAHDYYVIHFGDPNHDETAGVVGHAPDRITVVASIDELITLPEWTSRKLGLTCQTTASLEEFVRFQQAAREKWPHIEIFDTICNATNQRQTAIMDLAPHVDMILVVGSKTSANSRRLASISEAICGKGHLISSAKDIDERWFAPDQNVPRVGVTAGASTPDFLVEEVVQRLMELSGGKAEVTQQEKRERTKKTARELECH